MERIAGKGRAGVGGGGRKRWARGASSKGGKGGRERHAWWREFEERRRQEESKKCGCRFANRRQSLSVLEVRTQRIRSESKNRGKVMVRWETQPGWHGQ